MARLTKRRLTAIIEALNARLAGEWNAEFDEGHLDQGDYEKARAWAEEERDRREPKATSSAS